MAVFVSLGLAAQEKDDVPYRHEWRFGVSGLPVVDILALSDGWGYDDRRNFDIDDIFDDYDGTRRMMGQLSAEYSINYRKWFSFSVGGYLSTAWNKVYDYKGDPAGFDMGVTLHIAPTVRFKYINTDAFSMYIGLSAGIMLGYKDEMLAFPSFQIVPLGFTFGRKVFGFVELGGGFLYLGGNAGIGYRF